MKTKIVIQILILLIVMACSSNSSKKNEPANQMDINEWFENGEWREGLEITPDESINKAEFFAQYCKRKELWDKAFEYLKTADLDSLQVGKIELKGDSLFAVVTEYLTRDDEESSYEAHQKYADIQYLISGEEKMGVAGLDKSTITVPYDESNDIVFLNAPDDNLRMANDKLFFVFFPDDAHRPCMKIDEKSPVKKIVLKVRVD
ncbi:YhcH/YjgK/YiaL family protein [Bacteroidota bacterium]